MRRRLRPVLTTVVLLTLGIGGVACDDTVDGIQEDTVDNINEIDEELDTEGQ